MKSTRNSDRLRDILLSTRHQIVALKDIQIDLMRLDAKVANQASTVFGYTGRKCRAKTQWMVLWSFQD
jgi:hypothetical protein